MIRLFRGQEPAELTANKKAWTTRWNSRHAKGATDWATKRILRFLRAELTPMSFGKCVFCEGRLGSQSFPEVEHYVAKTVDVDLVFEWSNLFMVCRRCNGSKSRIDHQSSLLKPDSDDGEEYFWVNLANGELEPNPALQPEKHFRASESIRICDLNRGDLCADRITWVEMVGSWAERIAAGTGAGGDRELKIWLAPETPYKLSIRFRLTQTGLGAIAVEDMNRFKAASKSHN